MAMMERPGVFTMTDPKQHAARRRLFARTFSKTHLRQHWEPVIRETVDLAVARMQDDAQSSGTEIVDVMKFMASDISSHLMFGEDFHNLERGEVNQYMRVLANRLMAGGIAAELPNIQQIGVRLPFQAAKELFACNQIMEEYGKAAVTNTKARGSTKNIFSNLMAEAEKGDRLGDRDVELEATNLIVAGTDTTAITLTYLAEVAALPREYTHAELETLPLLNATLQETLRLYGAAAAMLPRVVPSGGVNLDGYFLPEGNIATTRSYSLHRDPYLFLDPEE
ncbi:hypothetical protein LTR95_015520 [Oleoguttula sp. CCFEE 5521]